MPASTNDMTEADVADLRAHGFSDAEILDIAAAAANRNWFSRMPPTWTWSRSYARPSRSVTRFLARRQEPPAEGRSPSHRARSTPHPPIGCPQWPRTRRTGSRLSWRAARRVDYQVPAPAQHSESWWVSRLMCEGAVPLPAAVAHSVEAFIGGASPGTCTPCVNVAWIVSFSARVAAQNWSWCWNHPSWPCSSRRPTRSSSRLPRGLARRPTPGSGTSTIREARRALVRHHGFTGCHPSRCVLYQSLAFEQESKAEDQPGDGPEELTDVGRIPAQNGQRDQ